MALLALVAAGEWTDVWIFSGVLALGVVTLFLVHMLFGRLEGKGRATRTLRQVVMLALSLAMVIGGVITLPEPFADQRGDLLQFLGIVLSAALALSSTTLLGNLLAGFMVRSVRRLRVGDFIEVDDHFGRVTERGLLFTEIQTPQSDLVELPNLFLAQNPVKLLRDQGTIVSAEVSLGYDTPHKRISEALLRAAESAELKDPFVLVIELGDFSVTYRVGGMLHDVKSVLSANSRLRTHMLDALHGDGIEIVSPTFMNTRVKDPKRPILPSTEAANRPTGATTETPANEEVAMEEIAFEEAERAETLEGLRAEAKALEQTRKKQAAALKAAPDDRELSAALEKIDTRLERLKTVIRARESTKDGAKRA